MKAICVVCCVVAVSFCNPVFAQGQSKSIQSYSQHSQQTLPGQNGAGPDPNYSEFKPGPKYVPSKNDLSQFATKTLNAMPEFQNFPAYPGKPLRYLGGNTYGGEGSVKSASFEVGQPVKDVLAWYSQSLKMRGWKLDEQNYGYSAHVVGTIPNQATSVDVQLMKIDGQPYKTRVHLKETNHQNVAFQTVGGGTAVSPDAVPHLQSYDH